jgi:hypothetical protein
MPVIWGGGSLDEVHRPRQTSGRTAASLTQLQGRQCSENEGCHLRFAWPMNRVLRNPKILRVRLSAMVFDAQMPWWRRAHP